MVLPDGARISRERGSKRTAALFYGQKCRFSLKNVQFEKLENFCEHSLLEILKEIIFI
jgi:HEPN domain-containing protein